MTFTDLAGKEAAENHEGGDVCYCGQFGAFVSSSCIGLHWGAFDYGYSNSHIVLMHLLVALPGDLPTRTATSQSHHHNCSSNKHHTWTQLLSLLPSWNTGLLFPPSLVINRLYRYIDNK